MTPGGGLFIAVIVLILLKLLVAARVICDVLKISRHGRRGWRRVGRSS